MSKRVPMREMVLVSINKRSGKETNRRNVFVRVTEKSLIWDRSSGVRELFTHEGIAKRSNHYSFERWHLEPKP